MKPMILGIAAAGMLISAGSFAQTTTSPSTTTPSAAPHAPGHGDAGP